MLLRQRPVGLYSSSGSPPLGFVKVNFDGSVRGALGGAGFVIRDSEGRLLAAGGSFLYEPSVPGAELRAARAGITCAIQELYADRILIEGDSATVIAWIQYRSKQSQVHPLLRDIWHSLRLSVTSTVRHIFREANSVAN